MAFSKKRFWSAINLAGLTYREAEVRTWNQIGETYIAEYEKGLTLDDSKRKAALDAWQQSLSINRAQAKIMALTQKYSKAPMFQP